MHEPFHPGEIAIQEMTGERHRAVLTGKIISSVVPVGARPFISDQQLCVAASAVPDGQIWPCIIPGHKGFASSDATGSHVTIHFPSPLHTGSSPPLDTARVGDKVATLFIDLSSRKRLRVNGVIDELNTARLRFAVEQAFSNCPKYIQRRDVAAAQFLEPQTPLQVQGTVLDARVKEWVRAADTFFVSSSDPSGSLDVSHRGGNPGFVRIENQSLRIPDYPGNSLFMTLGNLASNPRCGLVFPDFKNGWQLQMIGGVTTDFHSYDRVNETGGTQRWWTFTPSFWQISPLQSPFRWTLVERSPYNPTMNAMGPQGFEP